MNLIFVLNHVAYQKPMEYTSLYQEKDYVLFFVELMRLPEENVAKFEVTRTKLPKILMVTSY